MSSGVNNFEIFDIQKVEFPLRNIQQYTSFNQTLTSLTNTYVQFPLNAVITPTSSTSKILITISGQLENTAGDVALATIFRNGVSIPEITFSLAQVFSSVSLTAPVTMIYLDSPNSTSPQTYNVAFRSGGLNTVSWGPNTVIVLQEIEG